MSKFKNMFKKSKKEDPKPDEVKQDDTDLKQEQKTDNNNNNNNNNTKKSYNIVVFDGDRSHNWPQLFHNKILSNKATLNIFQVSWNKAELTVYGDSNECIMNIEPIHTTKSYQLSLNKKQDNQKISSSVTSVKPDFIIVRNQPRGAIPETDRRHVLFGLMMANIPSINTLESIYMNLERPIMMGALKSIENKLSKDEKYKFPLIHANYYSSYKQMIISPQTPCIIKVDHAHAGMGKIKCTDQVFRDVATILAVKGSYCTAEPYIEPKYGIRVQKVGKKYCVMKKEMTGGGSGWKSQFGGSFLTEIELNDKYKFWADECSKLFGGMDILAVDVIHGKDDKDYVIELNGTSIGILTERWKKDSIEIVQMAIDKMNKLYC